MLLCNIETLFTGSIRSLMIDRWICKTIDAIHFCTPDLHNYDDTHLFGLVAFSKVTISWTFVIVL